MTVANKDEILEKELEAARLADQLAQTTSEPEEIIGLHTAFRRIQEKIDWHNQQIDSHTEQIASHHQKIAELRNTLQTQFSGLLGKISGLIDSEQNTPKRGRPPGSGSTQKKRGPKGQGHQTTSDLIMACLQKAGKPVDTKYVTKYLHDHDRKTNPSVELNRMKKKGLITQPERGLYELAGSE